MTNLLQKKKIGSNLDRLCKKSEKESEKEEQLIFSEIKTQKFEIEEINDDEQWIHENLIVKIKDNTLKNGEYFNKKAKIINVIDKFLAEIELIDNKNKIRIDQLLIEPIIPAINSNVIILCGTHKWKIGKLTELNIKNKYVKVEINENINYISIRGICKI